MVELLSVHGLCRSHVLKDGQYSLLEMGYWLSGKYRLNLIGSGHGYELILNGKPDALKPGFGEHTWLEQKHCPEDGSLVVWTLLHARVAVLPDAGYRQTGDSN